jgi:hypothetical protein
MPCRWTYFENWKWYISTSPNARAMPASKYINDKTKSLKTFGANVFPESVYCVAMPTKPAK